MKWIVIAHGVAVIAGLCVIAFLAIAAYLGLAEIVQPFYAALLTAAGLALVAFGIPFAARLAARSGRGAGARSPDERLIDGVERALQSRTDPAVNGFVARHPGGAAAATLALGVAAGYSRTVYRVLQDMYQGYAVAERERRGSAKD